MILAGKRGEMIFEFTPSSTDTAEAFYRFEVPEHGISELFLFVGTVLEPRVAFDITRVDFGAIMLGSRCTETVHLVNSEHLPFAFNFEKPALDDESAVKKANKGPTLRDHAIVWLGAAERPGRGRAGLPTDGRSRIKCEPELYRKEEEDETQLECEGRGLRRALQ